MPAANTQRKSFFALSFVRKAIAFVYQSWGRKFAAEQKKKKVIKMAIR